MTPLPEELQLLYPFASHFLDLGAKQATEEGGGEPPPLAYHYLDEGEGPAVVMFHGNPTWSFYYRKLVTRLSDHHRCIVPDHIGCGLSSKPQRYPYRLDNHVRNAEELLSHLNLERFSIVVHDWGGPIGFALAGKIPDRVEKIVVLNTAAFLSQDIPLRLRLCRTPLLGAFLIRGLNAFAGLAVHMAVTKAMPAEVRRGYLYPYNSWRNRIATHRFVQDIPLNAKHPSHGAMRAVEANLPKLQDKPMLICWGLRDFVFTEAFLEGWKSRFPNAKVHTFPDAGHYLLEDAGDEVSELVKKFLV